MEILVVLCILSIQEALLLVIVSVQADEDFSPCDSDSDSDCEVKHHKRPKCLLEAGTCSNPFVSGCLNSYVRDNNATQLSSLFADEIRTSIVSSMLREKRVCNTDDDRGGRDDAEEGSLDCRPSPMKYPEIRVHNADWESPMFYSRVFQILLSEVLQVPVTVGLGPDDTLHKPVSTIQGPN
jgi:hypothetical protein